MTPVGVVVTTRGRERVKVASHRGFINEIRDVSKRQNMAKYAYYTFFFL